MRESLCPDKERFFVVIPASEKEEWDGWSFPLGEWILSDNQFRKHEA